MSRELDCYLTGIGTTTLIITILAILSLVWDPPADGTRTHMGPTGKYDPK